MNSHIADGESRVPWSIGAVAQTHLIELRFAGSVTEADLECAVRDAVALAQRLGYRRFLADCREMTSCHSPSLLFQLASEVRNGPVGSVAREAVLVPDAPAALSSVRFWETTACNRGLVVRLFVDRIAAIHWLVQGG